MKKMRSFFLPACFILFYSCQATLKQGDFKLLPLPQQFEITGSSQLSYDDIRHYYSPGNFSLPVKGELLKNIKPVEQESQAEIICRIDTLLELPAEGYRLEISGKQIRMDGKDKAGLLYAFITLEQLLEDAKEQDAALPLCNIVDYPLLSYRAIHLDIKHHREKTDYYYSLMDRLLHYKVNAVIVEMEDKLKYQLQPDIGSADALSMEEWKKLSEYAKERNIEISPLIQGLGHASFILKHEKYKSLRDNPESDWAFNPLDPRIYEVQFDLYQDALEATPHGRYLHVGGDEVHTTGRGSGKSALELQLIWLEKVCRFAADHGRIPIFWDDMPLKHAGVFRATRDLELSPGEVDKLWTEKESGLLDFLDQFPKNCVYMRWNYNAPQAAGNQKAMEWFRSHGMQVMGATAGQTRWVLMPQNESNINNIRFFALTSIDENLDGLLLTLWDDDSPHFELYKRGIIAFSEYTWAGDKRSVDDLKSAYRQREFSCMVAGREFAFIDQLERPVAFWNNALLNGNKRLSLVKLDNPGEEAVIDLPDPENKGEWSIKHADRLEQAASVRLSCDSIAGLIGTMKSLASRNSYTLEVYEQVNELVRFSAKILLTLKAYDSALNGQEESDILNQIRQLPEEFEALRAGFEEVYGQVRILTKPEDFILDQGHHRHLANQAISFDWQFYAEMLFLEKIQNDF